MKATYLIPVAAIAVVTTLAVGFSISDPEQKTQANTAPIQITKPTQFSDRQQTDMAQQAGLLQVPVNHTGNPLKDFQRMPPEHRETYLSLLKIQRDIAKRNLEIEKLKIESEALAAQAEIDVALAEKELAELEKQGFEIQTGTFDFNAPITVPAVIANEKELEGISTDLDAVATKFESITSSKESSK